MRFFIESFLDFVIVAMLNLIDQTYDSYGDYVCVVASGLFVLFAVASPIALSIFLYKNFYRLEDETIENRLGEVVEN